MHQSIRCAASAMTLVAALQLAAPAIGAEPKGTDIQIEHQPLSSALQEFARQSGVQVAVRAELTDGKSVPSVQGVYEPTEALRELLTGTGLEAYPVNARMFGSFPTMSATCC